MSPSGIERTLAAHGQALRALARDLVGDGDADDLVQETALQALRSEQQPRLPIAWLRNLMRFLASRHHRGERRRRAREARWAADAPQPPADRDAELADSMRSLTDELLALPTPYRETLLQRYLQDRTPAEIAARSGTSLATVKSRLARGLGLLRERLDRGRGDDWRAALVVTFALPTGITIMTTATKMTFAAGAAALVFAALWLIDLSGGEAAPATDGGGRDAHAATAMLERGDHSGATNPGEQPQALPRQPLSARQTILLGRCIDEHGQPLGGCEVTLSARLRESRNRAFGRELAEWLADRELPAWSEPSVTTDGSGTFSFAFDWSPFWFELHLRRDQLVQPVVVAGLSAGERRDVGDLVVASSCAVSGIVVDVDGQPVRRPWLPRHDLSEPDAFPTLLYGDDTGRFATHLLPGRYRFVVQGRTLTTPQPIEVPAGVARLALRLEVATSPPSRRISGEVLDERNRPVAGATVFAWNAGDSGIRAVGLTDGAGRFEVHCLSDDPPEVAQVVWCKDGHVTQELDRVPWGAADLQLSLPHGRSGEVHVTAADTGAPVESFAVYLQPASDNQLAHSGTSLGDGTSDTHEHGVARIAGFAPGDYWLCVAPVRSDLAADYRQVTVLEHGPIRFDVALPAGGVREVRVQFGDGQPITGSRVEVIDPRGRPFELGSGADTLWYCEGGGAVRLDDARTDARGVARVRGRRGEPLLLRVTGQHPGVLVESFSLAATEPLVVEINRPGRVAGRIGPPELVARLRSDSGLPAVGAAPERVSGSMPCLRLLTPDRRDGDRPSAGARVSVASDGSFAIEGVEPGDWWLGLDRWQFGRRTNQARRAEPIADVTVVAGETARVDVDLRDWLPAIVRGQLLADGVPMPWQRAILYSHGRDVHGRPLRTWTRIATDDAGRFEAMVRAGRLEVHVTSNGADRSWTSFVCDSQVRVRPGEQRELAFAHASATLRLRLFDADGMPVVGAQVQLLPAADPSGRRLALSPRSDTEGRIECRVPIAPLSVQILPERLQSLDAQRELRRTTGSLGDPLPRHRIELLQFTPQAGASIEREVPLPHRWHR